MPPVDNFGIVGTVIAEKYRVDSVVDEGGFSVVYKAEHLIWREPVALKCFRALAAADPSQRDQLLDTFIQEGKLMASLSSRSAAIVQARDIGKLTTASGQWVPYMVMEWLEGKPLDIVLYEERKARMPPRAVHEALALLEPVAVALELCHGRNIAHRDIKPGNLFVLGNPRGADVRVKLLDFGIAKVMETHAAKATASAHTGNEITAFTPNYGAPEQFSRSHGATGPWTDVFALGLIFVEILRGGVAALEGNDFIQLAVASRDPGRRPTPRTFGIEVTDEVERVFQQAFAIDPAERYKSMGEFWTSLHQAVFPEAPTWGVSSGAVAGRPSMVSAPGPTTGQQRVGTTPLEQLGLRSAAAPPSQTPPSGPDRVPSVATPPVVTPPVQPPKKWASWLSIGAVLAFVVGGVAAFRLFPKGASPGPSAEAPGTMAPGTNSGPSTGITQTATAAGTAASTATAGPTEKAGSCPEGMVLVPGGKFFMGSDEPEFKLWQPAHKVTLDSFCVDIYEVTADAYKACSDQGECKRPRPAPDYPKSEGVSDEEHAKTREKLAEQCTFGKEGRGRHPINCVSYFEAEAYCAVQKKRLPTEAEWEFAARGSDGRKFPWGDDPGGEKHMNACGRECNDWERAHGLKVSKAMYAIDDGYPMTAPVGSFPEGKTKYGTYDVVGNVWEWTSDWFETYKPDEVVNPKGAKDGDKKAIRGGGFNGGFALWLNPAFRYHQLATATAPGIGFRCAKNL